LPLLAYVLVRTKPGTSYEILQSRKIPGVKMANIVFGTYDAVLVIAAKDMDEFSTIVYDIIEKHPNVERTECLVAIPYPPEEAKPATPPAEMHTVVSFYCPNCNALNERGSVFCPFCGYMWPSPGGAELESATTGSSMPSSRRSRR
jgi:hypothetical protein